MAVFIANAHNLFYNRHMLWIDPANWTTNENELAAMNELVEHFKGPLARCGFDQNNMRKECNGMKVTYKRYCMGQTAAQFWTNTLCHR